jgi:hypothetical protein
LVGDGIWVGVISGVEDASGRGVTVIILVAVAVDISVGIGSVGISIVVGVMGGGVLINSVSVSGPDSLTLQPDMMTRQQKVMR